MNAGATGLQIIFLTALEDKNWTEIIFLITTTNIWVIFAVFANFSLSLLHCEL